MARVLLTAAYESLTRFPGDLFEASSFTVLVRSATTFTYVLGPASPFAGMRVTVTGAGFTWQGADATGGNIAKIVITSGATTILTIDSLVPNTLASSLEVFQDNVFGWTTPAGRKGPDGTTAISHLLSGNDTIVGTAGDDNEPLVGHQAGNDMFNLLGGNDVAWGGIGNDTILGGAGWDRLTYERSTWTEGGAAFRGVDVRIGATPGTGAAIDCWGNVDRFSGIETVRGSRFADRFTGGAGREEFEGLAGADTINGGGDSDTLRYDSDYWNGGKYGIVVNLQTAVVNGATFGRIRDGFGSLDTVINVERVIGTRFADSFTGSLQRNEFSGGEGKDSYNGIGLNDGDRIRFDRQFSEANQTGITVDLRRTTGQVINDGYGNIENAVSIEQIVGSRQADRIIMNGASNIVNGHDGRDILTGAGGTDSFVFGDRAHLGDNDLITDFAAAGLAGNIDQLDFDTEGIPGMSRTLSLVNGTRATLARDQFIFNTATDILYWDPDGTGAAAAIPLCTLTGVVALSAANFEFY